MSETTTTPTVAKPGVKTGRWRRRRYLGLILYKTYAELRAESSRTYLGFVWWVAEPLLSMAVYYFVFKFILNYGTENYAIFLIVALIPWRWFSAGIMHGAQAILGARSLMQQVYLPKVVLPIVSLLSDTFKFAVILLVLVPFLALVGFPPGRAYLALPIVIFTQGVFTAGLTLLCAATTPFLPDMRMVLDSLLRLWFFVSGIFHPVDGLSEHAQFFLRLNPMTNIIEAYRDVLLEGQWPDLSRLGTTVLVSVLLMVIGERLIRRLDFQYPKISR